MSEIPIGSRWRDNDPRLPDRVVTVDRVDEHFVWYRFLVRCRSRRDRFLKAFTREVGNEAKPLSEASPPIQSAAQK